MQAFAAIVLLVGLICLGRRSSRKRERREACRASRHELLSAHKSPSDN